MSAKPVPLFFSARWFCFGGDSVKKLLIMLGFWLISLPLVLCQESKDYLTGLSASGPFIGVAVIIALFLLLWVLRKFLLKLILVSIVAVTFGGIGLLLGSFFLPAFQIPLGGAFLIFGLWVSLKLLKAQKGEVVVTRSSLGGRDNDVDFFWGDDEWED